MLIPLSATQAVLVSVAVWTAVGFVTGYWVHSRPVSRFTEDRSVTRLRRWEDGGEWYQRHLGIRRWKDKLPEKGDFFRGGYSKRSIRSRDRAELNRFAVETRRAESVHWMNLIAGLAFPLWCPPAIGAVMVTFGIAAHLPFVVIQRYNRGRILRIMARPPRPRAPRLPDATNPRRSGGS